MQKRYFQCQWKRDVMIQYHRIFAVECTLLESKIVFSLMDILGIFTRAPWILDEDGNGSGNDDVDDKHDNENFINYTREADACLNKAIIGTVWLSVMVLCFFRFVCFFILFGAC